MAFWFIFVPMETFFSKQDLDFLAKDVMVTNNLLDKATNPIWIKAFKFYNRHNAKLEMSCRNCYPKVFMFVVQDKNHYLRQMDNTQDSVWEKKPTQDSWFRTTTPFEASFKYWFALMWQNGYILLFLLSLAFFAGMLYDLQGIQKLWSLVPGLAMIAISYLGFWQYYQDMKNNTSR